MPEALWKRAETFPEEFSPNSEKFELTTASDAMSAFEQICFAIPASGAIIVVRNTNDLHCVASLGDAPEVGSRLPSDFAIAFKCLETGSVVLSDLPDDTTRAARVGATMEGVSRIRSAVALPMRADGALVGLISVFSPRRSSIQPRDVDALERVADFWGPLMADEWFPDGVPAAISGYVPDSDTPLEHSFAVESTPPTAADPSAQNHDVVVATLQEIAATLPPEGTTEAPTAPVESTLIDREKFPSATQNEGLHTDKNAMPTKATSIAEIANAPKSPMFLAPTAIKSTSSQAFGTHRIAWIVVVLGAILALLVCLWYVRSHSRRHDSTVDARARQSREDGREGWSFVSKKARIEGIGV